MKRRAFAQSIVAAGAASALPLELKGLSAGRVAPLKVNGARLNDHLTKLSEFGKNPQGGVSRVAYSDADKASRPYLMQLMRDAKLDVSVDAAGNLVGKRAGTDSTLKPILFGSHTDSVPFGGNFDGDVGSLGAIEVAQTLSELHVTTRHPLEVADEAEAIALEVLAQGPRGVRGRRYLTHVLPSVHHGRAVDERPEVAREVADPVAFELAFQREEGPSVVDHGRDLRSIAHDPGVAEELLHLRRREAGDLHRVEARETRPVALAFIENRAPGEPRLGPLERQLLEQSDPVALRCPPLDVVVFDHQRIGASPLTAAQLGHVYFRSRPCGPGRSGPARPMSQACSGVEASLTSTCGS